MACWRTNRGKMVQVVSPLEVAVERALPRSMNSRLVGGQRGNSCACRRNRMIGIPWRRLQRLRCSCRIGRGSFMTRCGVDFDPSALDLLWAKPHDAPAAEYGIAHAKSWRSNFCWG